MKPTAPKIVNPYASTKRKQPPPSTSASKAATTSSTRQGGTSSSASTTAHHQQQQQQSSSSSNSHRLLHSAPTGAAAAAAAAAGDDLLAGKRIVHAASFSQAFESVVPNRSNSTTNSNQSNNNGQQQQQQQHDHDGNVALDRAAQQNINNATAAAAGGNNNNSNNMSDRDSHVLLHAQPHVLYVSTKQRGNGLLQYIRNVPYAYSRMVPDYVLSPTQCALFLSCKYHSLYPNYIHRRIAELKQDFALRILLVLVDVQDNAQILRLLNKICVTNNLTLILAWSEEEAARYLETYKAFHGRDATLIQRKEQTHFPDQVADFLSAATYNHRSVVNKTDAATLLVQFNTVRSLAAASMDELGLVSGMGQVKVRRLHDAFHKPFSKKRARERRRRKKKEQEEQQQAEAAAAQEEDIIAAAAAAAEESLAEKPKARDTYKKGNDDATTEEEAKGGD